MNRERTIEAIKVMQAWVDGKGIEVTLRDDTDWATTVRPAWNWYESTYRIKPASTLRPWTADEVPLGAIIRFKEAPYDRHLLGWVSVQADRDLWLEEREYSTDGGKTWLPCGVMEEAKP
jgi:hypothetical protein